MQVKIYTKNMATLTTLLTNDVESLEFIDKKDGDGSGSFVIRADTQKVTKANIQMYNRIKIFEGDVCKFYGFISEISYSLNTIKISFFSIGILLKNRTLGSSYNAVGTISSILTNMLSMMNTASDTGISIGNIVDDGLTYSKVYDSGNSFDYIVRDLIGVDKQFRVDQNGLIQLAPVLGNDLSNNLKIKYNINQVANSNITNFSVKESGQSVITEMLAKRTGGEVVVTNPTLVSKYGLLQATKTYEYVYNDTDLTTRATKDLRETLFTPDITLAPNFPDTFEVLDFLGIAIYNKFIDIKEKYQVLEKQYTCLGREKTIRIKLNDSQKNLIEILLEQKERIKLLENSQ